MLNQALQSLGIGFIQCISSIDGRLLVMLQGGILGVLVPPKNAFESSENSEKTYLINFKRGKFCYRFESDTIQNHFLGTIMRSQVGYKEEESKEFKAALHKKDLENLADCHD